MFLGFQPSNEVNRLRNSISIYGGIETEITDQFMIDIGRRFENYSDFGKRAIGKVAARFELVENFAFGGALGTGFRPSSVHQVWSDRA